MMQQGQRHSGSNNRSELFKYHREEPVSGFLGFPHKQDVNNFSGHLYSRTSHSGPLVHGPGWTKGVKGVDEQPVGSSRVNLSKPSGLVASRTSSSETREEKHVSSQRGKTIEARKFMEPSNGSQSKRRQDQKRHFQRLVDLGSIESGRAPDKDSTPVSLLSFHA